MEKAMKKATINVVVKKTKKEIHKFAKSIEIKLVIKNPSFEINYLDLNSKLKQHSYYPIRIPINKINYVNANSNYPIAQVHKINRNQLPV